MLTRDFSCSQRRARDGCCIATMPPGARLVWVRRVDRDGAALRQPIPQMLTWCGGQTHFGSSSSDRVDFRSVYIRKRWATSGRFRGKSSASGAQIRNTSSRRCEIVTFATLAIVPTLDSPQ